MKFFVLVVAPIVEIVVAAVVAHFIGWGWTMLALVALSALGVWQIKVQGFAAWAGARQDLADGGSPAPSVLDGALGLVGAVLLAAPGFVSGIVGSVLLVRATRAIASRRAGSWVVARFGLPFVVVSGDNSTGWRFGSPDEPDYVDVDGWEEPVAASDRRQLTSQSGQRS